MVGSTTLEGHNTARVLVFSVDDGNFCIHLDWVEAVYPRNDTELHSLKNAAGMTHKFLIHRGQPAWVLDPRETFGLNELLGTAERTAFAVVRAGSGLLALQVDACIGVRNLDLGSKVPVPSTLLRDGGFPIGHLVEIDGRLHALLEPSRILSSALRDRLDPLLNEALAFRDRQAQIDALAAELRQAPTLAGLKAYGRLSRRNGRARTAVAVRSVVRAAEANHTVDGTGDLAADTLLRDLVAVSVAGHTGEVQLHLPNGTATIHFETGRIADACIAGEWGRGALKEILATRQGIYRFNPSDTPVHPQRIDDATLWTLVEAIAQLSAQRRARHLR